MVGVAHSGWARAELRKRARDSIAHAGGIDNKKAFKHLMSLMRYVDGDYEDEDTFAALKKVLGHARRPAHYLAIPPALFGTVVIALRNSGLAEKGRVIIAKPFGHDLASAKALKRVAQSAFAEDRIFRIDHLLATEPVDNIL